MDEILNSLTDPHTKKLVFFVSWKEREDGTKPFPSWQTHENMR